MIPCYFLDYKRKSYDMRGTTSTTGDTGGYEFSFTGGKPFKCRYRFTNIHQKTPTFSCHPYKIACLNLEIVIHFLCAKVFTPWFLTSAWLDTCADLILKLAGQNDLEMA